MQDATTPSHPSVTACPSWCTVPHDDEDQLEQEARLGQREHSAGVSGFWQAEIRGGGRSPIVLRPRGSLVDVLLAQVEQLDGSGVGSLEQVRVWSLEGLSLSLTASESRSLAAMLVRGADRLEGLS